MVPFIPTAPIAIVYQFSAAAFKFGVDNQLQVRRLRNFTHQQTVVTCFPSIMIKNIIQAYKSCNVGTRRVVK